MGGSTGDSGTVDPRPRADRPRAGARGEPRRQRRAGPRGRAVRLPAGLVRRAPQHAPDRVVGHQRPDRPRRRPHLHDPARRRRDHAAEPRAADHRRAVRHAGQRSTRGGSTSASAARPASDQNTMYALRRDPATADAFPAGRAGAPGLPRGRDQGRRASTRHPGRGTHVPLYILGSSLFGAQLAAALGLPYAFASHFAPAALEVAVSTYRREFKPSAQLDRALRHRRRQRDRRRHDAADARAQLHATLIARVRGFLGRGQDWTDAQAEQVLASAAGAAGRPDDDVRRRRDAE